MREESKKKKTKITLTNFREKIKVTAFTRQLGAIGTQNADLPCFFVFKAKARETHKNALFVKVKNRKSSHSHTG